MASPDHTSHFRLMGSVLLAATCIAAPARSEPELVGPPSEYAIIPEEGADLPAASNSPANLSLEQSDEEAKLSPAAAQTESLPLGRAARSSLEGIKSSDAGAATSGVGWWAQTGAALVLVVGLILALKWGAQRLARRASGIAWQMGPAGRAPSGVLEVLGRYPVARGQSLVLLKMDRRVLLLGQTAAGFSTLSEVSDPEEVASLLIKTRDDEGASMAARFNELLRDMERDPSIGGDTQEISAGQPATGPRLPRIGLQGVTA